MENALPKYPGYDRNSLFRVHKRYREMMCGLGVKKGSGKVVALPAPRCQKKSIPDIISFLRRQVGAIYRSGPTSSVVDYDQFVKAMQTWGGADAPIWSQTPTPEEIEQDLRFSDAFLSEPSGRSVDLSKLSCQIPGPNNPDKGFNVQYPSVNADWRDPVKDNAKCSAKRPWCKFVKQPRVIDARWYYDVDPDADPCQAAIDKCEDATAKQQMRCNRAYDNWRANVIKRRGPNYFETQEGEQQNQKQRDVREKCLLPLEAIQRECEARADLTRCRKIRSMCQASENRETLSWWTMDDSASLEPVPEPVPDCTKAGIGFTYWNPCITGKKKMCNEDYPIVGGRKLLSMMPGCNLVWAKTEDEELNAVCAKMVCDEPTCCMSMTAQCLACKDGITTTEYCAMKPTTPGCTTAPEPINPVRSIRRRLRRSEGFPDGS